MSLRQADILEAYLKKTSGVEGVKVYDRTGDAVIRYTGCREAGAPRPVRFSPMTMRRRLGPGITAPGS